MADDTQLFTKFGRTVNPGEIIFSEGNQGDQMFIIQSGKVKVTKRIGGRERILATLSKGDFFGEMAIVNNVTRTASVTAVTETELLAFNREGFQSMITKNAKIALSIIDRLCRRIQNMNLQIQQLVRKNSKGLVALNLVYAFKGSGKDLESLHYDRLVEEMAYNLEMPLETVKTTIEELVKEAVLSLDGNQIHLIDQDRLKELSEN